eukprot:TRINITY_DN68428_c0_g1_i1.p1 TRINITY_DN68428_c0_g1~~TRINITY_DN68428_c0_g1_i1.p1  ORF type:complete len:868 (+),score=88.43 TRINITY_DN68428_c0_g1_i1:102-2606(+)
MPVRVRKEVEKFSSVPRNVQQQTQSYVLPVDHFAADAINVHNRRLETELQEQKDDIERLHFLLREQQHQMDKLAYDHARKAAEIQLLKMDTPSLAQRKWQQSINRVTAHLHIQRKQRLLQTTTVAAHLLANRDVQQLQFDELNDRMQIVNEAFEDFHELCFWWPKHLKQLRVVGAAAAPPMYNKGIQTLAVLGRPTVTAMQYDAMKDEHSSQEKQIARFAQETRDQQKQIQLLMEEVDTLQLQKAESNRIHKSTTNTSCETATQTDLPGSADSPVALGSQKRLASFRPTLPLAVGGDDHDEAVLLHGASAAELAGKMERTGSLGLGELALEVNTQPPSRTSSERGPDTERSDASFSKALSEFKFGKRGSTESNMNSSDNMCQPTPRSVGFKNVGLESPPLSPTSPTSSRRTLGDIVKAQLNFGEPPRAESVIVDHLCKKVNKRKWMALVEKTKGLIRVVGRIFHPESLVDDDAANHTQFGCVKIRDNIISLTRDGTGHFSQQEYVVDSVLAPLATQAEVFAEAEMAIEEAFTGESQGFCCIAYGAVGAGKSYTVVGSRSGMEDGDINEEGLFPRTLRKVFRLIEQRTHNNTLDPSTVNITATVVEVHDNKYYDCLLPSSTIGGRRQTSLPSTLKPPPTPIVPPRSPSSTPRPPPRFPRASMSTASSATAIEITSAQEGINRVVNAIPSSSTMSSVVINLHVTYTDATSGVKYSPKLQFVECSSCGKLEKNPGSKSAATSLAALQMVLQAVWRGKAVIPWRESKLTSLLQDSIGPKRRCLVVLAIPANNSEDALNTLCFGKEIKTVDHSIATQRRKSVSNNKAMQQFRLQMGDFD